MSLSKKITLNIALILFNYITYSSSKPPQIIIIGAGPSGLAAAVKLHENAFYDIKILEAEDRIGGRINSVKFKNSFVDLGAEFCHGQVNNVVYDMAKDLDILKPRTQKPTQIYYSNGTRLRKDFEEDLGSFIFNFIDHDIADANALSLEDAFLTEYNSTLVLKYRSDNDQKLLREATKLAELLLVVSEGSFSLKETSAQTHYEESAGNHVLTWNGRGYKTMLDILMKAFPDKSKKIPVDETVIVKKTVSKITWRNKNQKVVIETSDNESYSADHVIFTPSLGVLKERHDSLFYPALSQEKKDAIENLGFDGIMKVIVHFPKKWWGSDFSDMFFLWSEEDSKNTLDEFKEGPIKDGVSWVSKVTNIVTIENVPNILLIWLSGEMVPEFEVMPVDVMKKGINYVLNKFLGHKFKITPIGDILMSRWCTNDNFRGTYSYEKTGFYKKELSYQKVLSEPLRAATGRPLVQFAGEATNPVHFATVHGAIETGFREAQRIIDYYKPQDDSIMSIAGQKVL